MTDLCHITDAKLEHSAVLLLYNVMLWQAQSRLAVTVCSLKVASTEGAVLSTVSDTTTSKTCLRKACHDLVTPVTWQSRQLTRGQARPPQMLQQLSETPTSSSLLTGHRTNEMQREKRKGQGGVKRKEEGGVIERKFTKRETDTDSVRKKLRRQKKEEDRKGNYRSRSEIDKRLQRRKKVAR